METFIQFVSAKLAESNQGTQRNIQEKYAAFTVFCSLASKLKSQDEFKNSLNEFIERYVIPEQASPYGFMRTKVKINLFYLL